MSPALPATDDEERFAAARQRMVEHQLRARGIRDERVLTAMGRVPRERFVGDRYGASSSPRTSSYRRGTNDQTSWAMNFT